MDSPTVLVLPIISTAVGFVVLFYVVRGAVLSALRAHHAELQPKAVPTSHLDADGL